jgi:hypothetical protein
MDRRLNGSQNHSKYGNISSFRAGNLTSAIRSGIRHTGLSMSTNVNQTHSTLDTRHSTFGMSPSTKNFQPLSSVLWQLIADCPQNDASLAAASSIAFQPWNNMFSVVSVSWELFEHLNFSRSCFFFLPWLFSKLSNSSTWTRNASCDRYCALTNWKNWMHYKMERKTAAYEDTASASP